MGAVDELSVSATAWRRDIQMLRGLAVSAVASEHFGLPVRSGFLGVDLFIVISGYVVSGVLLRMASGPEGLSLGRFFTARIRRLAPAHFACVIVVLVVAGLFGDPSGRGAAVETARASALSLANIQLFVVGQDYFQTMKQGQVFGHLWSLSLEEQFYVGAALGFSIWAQAKRLVSGALVRITLRTAACLVALALFLAAVPHIVSGESGSLNVGRIQLASVDDLSFHSPLARAWQFLLGLLALVGRSHLTQERIRLCRGVGVAVVPALLSVLFLAAPATQFFSWQRISVTLLSALALYIGVPTFRAMEWLGDRSYSLYLWHWPIAVGLGLSHVDRWLDHKSGAAIGATLVTSSLSHRFIERPMRTASARAASRSVAGYSLWLGAILVLAGTVVIGADAIYSVSARVLGVATVRSGDADQIDRELREWYGDRGCREREEYWYACGALDPHGIVIVGDSHAWSLAPGLAEEADRQRIPVAIRVRAGCPVAPRPDDICHDWAAGLAEEIASTDHTSVLVVACARIADGCPGGLSTSEDSLYARSTASWMRRRWQVSADRVYVLADIPYVEWVGKSVWNILRGDSARRVSRRLDLNVLQQRRRLALMGEMRLADSDGLYLFSSICSQSDCLAYDAEDRELWRDEDHLTLAGSRLVGAEAAELLARLRPVD